MQKRDNFVFRHEITKFAFSLNKIKNCYFKYFVLIYPNEKVVLLRDVKKLNY